jgi:hypothetical protein
MTTEPKEVTKSQIGRIVQLLVSGKVLHADAQRFIDRYSKKAKVALGKDEYLVPVGYDMPRDKATLEAEFSKGGVSDLFYGGYEWQNHSSCAGIDQTPGSPKATVMLVKQFGRAMTSEAAIAEMDRLGYRPATHLEAYAFAKANPDLQSQFWIVALGSSAVRGGGRYVAMLRGASGGRLLGAYWFDRVWNGLYRFLAVRK